MRHVLQGLHFAEADGSTRIGFSGANKLSHIPRRSHPPVSLFKFGAGNEVGPPRSPPCVRIENVRDHTIRRSVLYLSPWRINEDWTAARIGDGDDVPASDEDICRVRFQFIPRREYIRLYNISLAARRGDDVIAGRRGIFAFLAAVRWRSNWLFPVTMRRLRAYPPCLYEKKPTL